MWPCRYLPVRSPNRPSRVAVLYHQNSCKIEYFLRANALYPIFRRETYMQKLHSMYDHPEQTLEIGWLTSFNNVLLFGLYSITKAKLENCEQLVKRLVNNVWIALTDVRFIFNSFKEPLA